MSQFINYESCRPSVKPVIYMSFILRPIFIFLFYSFLYNFVFFECYPTSSPCPSMRQAKFAYQCNYDRFYACIYETLIFTSLICITLCNIASIFIKNTKYITFDTCLDFLPPHLTTKHDWDLLFRLSYKIAYVYLVSGPLLFSLSEDLHSIISQLIVELLVFIFKTYVLTYLNFIYSCKILFPELYPYSRLVFLWFFARMLLLSSDIETQPGPCPSVFNDPVRGFSESFFSFCNWNINTLSKNDFQRVSLLEAHNSIFKYDIISLCETSLNEATKVPENILKGYHFFPSNHPSGDKKGGVGIFFKESLPLKIRHDLSFEECIVTELIFGRKTIFFTVLYRNPIIKVGTPEFENFVKNFGDLIRKL